MCNVYFRSRVLLIDLSWKLGRGKCECVSRIYMKEFVIIIINDCKRLYVYVFVLLEGK